MKILVCPLNWGLGHATRCVPIILQLMAQGHELAVAANGFPLEFLQQEFPSLRFIEFPSYSISYSSGKSQISSIGFSIPKIIRGIVKEHFWLNKLLRTEPFDQIISDNRFGMWHKCVHSIYITHQLMVKMPHGLKTLEPLVWFIHRCFINRYNECWIPDNNECGGLSGDLSHKYRLPSNAKFIGPLSRFQNLIDLKPNTKFEVVVVISGVEPQRTIFEESLIEKLRNESYVSLIICGKPQVVNTERKIGNVSLVSHLSDSEMASVLIGSKKIISRSGFSTIMDLSALNCLHKVEFIPTPGQTEQEYLAVFHHKK
ncbi:MAG: glycosyltransferase [Paludibacter sp.]|nr:glycosyltransferase [Paludibacter sp.]